jgi:hypothetical protein
MIGIKPMELLSLIILATPAVIAITATVAVFCFGKKWKKDQDQDPKST